MGIFSKLFGGGNARGGATQKPPIHGGDGLSDQTPAIVNCASMSVANTLIERFISDACGDGWERGIEFTVVNAKDSSKSLRLICVTRADGSEAKFYFDLTRPVEATAKLAGLK